MYIKVKVFAGSKKEEARQVSDDLWEISVKEKAKGNSANRRVVEIIRSAYTSSVVKIISGHHSPSKIFSIEQSG